MHRCASLDSAPAIGLMVRSELGLSPWDVLHQGISRHTGVPIGTISILLGIPIVLLWLPLGERPGLGTLLNVIIVGTSINLVLGVLPAASGAAMQVGYEAVGIAIYAVATGIYLSANFGAGPRDGLMTGLHHRFGWRIAYVRTAIEGGVLLIGFVLGGTIGLGTLAFALSIGALTELSLRIFDRDGKVLRQRIKAGVDVVPVEGAA
jgi:uncharacterized membrane protein YczE